MLKLKKSILFLVLLSFGFTATNCYGPFRLSKKLYDWNGNVGDKYIDSFVFIALLVTQVYTITIFADGIIFNSIEFWNGTNPITMNEDQKETKLVTDAGKTYQITASKNQFEVVQLVGPNKGETAVFAFNPSSKVWSLTSGSTSIDLVKVVENGTQTIVEAYTPTGTKFYTLNGEVVSNYSTAK